MSKRDQLNQTDAQTSKVLPEGFEQLITSAGNVLGFSSPAQKFIYQNNPANAAQLGKNRGEGNVAGK